MSTCYRDFCPEGAVYISPGSGTPPWGCYAGKTSFFALKLHNTHGFICATVVYKNRLYVTPGPNKPESKRTTEGAQRGGWRGAARWMKERSAVDKN